MPPEHAAEATRLARLVADTTAELARCLNDGTQLDPAHVMAPLIAATKDLHDVVADMALAAVSLDKEAAEAAQRAATRFLDARKELVRAMVRLPKELPRTVSGRRRDLESRPTEAHRTSPPPAAPRTPSPPAGPK